jgi:hypothetical protein|tara:strand:+ start:179 stop:568 length:390 start_codon:yes stop_codon:yes gene_type:complete
MIRLHLAAIVGVPACSINPTLSKPVNYDAHMNIINNISPAQKVLFPTTNSGYDIGEKDSYCTEKPPLRPISEYGPTMVLIITYYFPVPGPETASRHRAVLMPIYYFLSSYGLIWLVKGFTTIYKKETLE